MKKRKNGEKNVNSMRENQLKFLKDYLPIKEGIYCWS
jgi:hypothetical protein